MSGPLAGVRVIEMGAYTAGPLCGRYLSNLGAEVIKVEPIKGDPLRGFAFKVDGVSYMFHLHNYNKKGVAIDTGTDEGRRLVHALIARADVLIENFAYGNMDKWGFGYEALKKIQPGLIFCSCSGFGHTGPLRELRAFDSMIQGMSGVVSLTGYPDGPPVKVGISAADSLSAAAAAMNVVAALLHKKRTGRGQLINLSMQDVLGSTTAPFWPDVAAGNAVERDGNHDATLAPQNVYASADGLVAIEVSRDEELAALLDISGADADLRPATPAEAKRCEAALDGHLRAWVAPQRTADVVAACRARGVPAAPVQQMGDVAENPHTWVRGALCEVPRPGQGPESESGKLKVMGSPYRFSRSDAVVQDPAPVIGEHTAVVLRGVLGLDEEEIARLVAAGIVALGKPLAAADNYREFQNS